MGFVVGATSRTPSRPNVLPECLQERDLGVFQSRWDLGCAGLVSEEAVGEQGVCAHMRVGMGMLRLLPRP